MDNILTEKRISAILALQNKRKKHSQNPRLFEIYDKAIDLAFNPKREVNEFFSRNLIRDAKRILKRQVVNAPELIDFWFVENVENYRMPRELVNENSTPFHEHLFQTYYQMIIEQCALLHTNALAILKDTILHVPIRDTANFLQISESLVKKIRREIRTKILAIINN